MNLESQNCLVSIFTDNIQHTVATESGGWGSGYEELLGVWSLPDKGMKVLE